MNEHAIFEAIVGIMEPKARRTRLDQLCGGDVGLRARIEALLESHESSSQFLKTPAVEQWKAGNDQATAIQAGSGDAVDEFEDHCGAAADTMGEVAFSFLSPSTKPDSIGRLGHYEILQVLGQGAFGIVFKGFDETLHRLVAIKVLSPQMAATSPPRKRFLREARSAAAIRHENIVHVYSVEENPLPYLVMEFIDGQTLQQRLDGTGPLELSEVLRIGKQLAAGLAAAHSKGLIHRDIKPGNILVEKGPDLRIKITDFGLARAADDASLTRTGFISGTPMYMAPEQANGSALDHRADLFSLGSVLYVMASGRPPFRADSPVAVLKRVADDTPRPIQEIIPEVPEWLCSIISKLHCKNREDRIQSAQEVADLLARGESRLNQAGDNELQVFRQPVHVGKANSLVRQKAETQPAARLRHSLSSRWAILVGVLSVLVAGLVLAESTGFLFGSSFFSLFSSESKGQFDVERKSAEYVLSIGGSVQLNGREDEIRAVADLPREPFELTSIVLNGNRIVTDEGLAACGGCTKLQRLDLVYTPVTDVGLVHFAGNKNLKILHLAQSSISDTGFALFQGNPNLIELWLGDTYLTDRGLIYFKDCKDLRKLWMGGTQITDAGLIYFKDCQNLMDLSVMHTSVSDTGLAHFRNCRNLERLWLGSTQLTDAGFENFADCERLREVYLDRTKFSDAGLVHLKNAKSLSTLSLTQTAISDAGLSAIKEHNKLMYLYLQGTSVTAEGINDLKAALPACIVEWDKE